ncbi:WXG100 family type VII secretion target [Mycobacteroides abscessus]|uniref:WXG100 family type VII secretion target n=1 Tax=Mycobacteroides abscessus TaxID=36809 RepID=UPI00210760AE|nr:WXG100 family type VII secretion target [Mycobacteroides abscessus]
MSLSVGELKKVSVQSIRDIATGLRAKAASMRATQAGVTDLPHKGTWTGVAADNADHEIGHFATGVGRDAEAYEDAARKVDRAGDEFEGVKQLLSKLENEAAGKFSINEATGEVTPLTKDFNKADRDYIANTIKQLCAAGGQANDDLAAGIHATDASGATSPAGAGGGPLPEMPGSAIKPDGVVGGMQNIAGPKDGDPGATKAAAATAGSTDTINYKELYPKTTVDGHQLGSVGAVPGVGNIDKTKPAKLAPTLADRDVPAFKDLTRQNLINAKVPADQIEQRVNDAVKAAQAPHFLPDADPMRTPGEVPLHNSPGDQFNDIVGRANDEATKTIDGQIEQAKILTGQAGPGAPGVAEAWKDVGLGAAQQVHELTSDPLAAPKMGIEQAKDFYNHPGEFIGKNLIHGTEALAGGAIGGEAAAGARGLLGDLTSAEGHAITHGLDSPHPTPTVEHTPAGPVEHPSPSVGLDHPAPNAGGWNHSTEHYSPQAPQLAADLNNAFTNGHPTSDLAAQVADHSTHHAPGIGSNANPDRVVLGKWDGQDGGYIGEARHNGGIYFDTGGDTWNAVGRGLDEVQSKELGWQVNEQFLRSQLENKVSRVDYVLPDGFNSVEQVMRQRRESFSALEINFLKEHGAAYGYKQYGNSWVYEGGR